MGLYIFVTDQDRIDKRKVNDPEVNEAFQESLRVDPSLMIEERLHIIRYGILGHKKRKEVRYTICHETPAFDGSAYQARVQFSGSGNKSIALAYLHGIYNGATHYTTKTTTHAD